MIRGRSRIKFCFQKEILLVLLIFLIVIIFRARMVKSLIFTLRLLDLSVVLINRGNFAVQEDKPAGMAEFVRSR